MTNDNFSGLVTVIIPAYNAQKTISAAILSAQRLLDCRIIVVDDGSTDGTSAVCRSLGCEIVPQENQGANVARRTGIELVSTKFVVLLDADDQLALGVREALNCLEKSPDVAVAGGRVAVIDEHNTVLRTTRRIDADYSTQDLLSKPYSPWPPCAAVWRTAAIRGAMESEPKRLELKFAEDFELLIRTSRHGRVSGINTVTALYRADGGKSATRAVDAVEDSESTRSYYADQYGFPHRALSRNAIVDQASWRTLRAQQSQGKTLRTILENPFMFISASRHILRTRMFQPKRRVRTTGREFT